MKGKPKKSWKDEKNSKGNWAVDVGCSVAEQQTVLGSGKASGDASGGPFCMRYQIGGRETGPAGTLSPWGQTDHPRHPSPG